MPHISSIFILLFRSSQVFRFESLMELHAFCRQIQLLQISLTLKTINKLSSPHLTSVPTKFEYFLTTSLIVVSLANSASSGLRWMTILVPISTPSASYKRDKLLTNNGTTLSVEQGFSVVKFLAVIFATAVT